MCTLINGQESSQITTSDRGLLYGDGAFETIAIRGGAFVLLVEHLSRLQKACSTLRIPLIESLLLKDLDSLLRRADSDGVCKIIITRGSGGRGYKAASDMAPTRIVQFFKSSIDTQASTGVTVGISQHRLATQPMFSGLKHLNRLDQVLASFDIMDGYKEVLCLDQNENVIEGTKSNLIVVSEGKLSTPDLTNCGVRGIMLDALINKFSAAGHSVSSSCPMKIEDLRCCDELFLCNSIIGVWPVLKLVENASVTTWDLGKICQQAIHFQHEIFNVRT